MATPPIKQILLFIHQYIYLHIIIVHYYSAGEKSAKNITLSAEQELIQKARLKAQKDHSTLNEQFRHWLKKYVSIGSSQKSYKSVIEKYTYTNAGKSFNREELNER